MSLIVELRTVRSLRVHLRPAHDAADEVAAGPAQRSAVSLRYVAKCAGHASVGLARMSSGRLSKGQGGGAAALEPGFAAARSEGR